MGKCVAHKYFDSHFDSTDHLDTLNSPGRHIVAQSANRRERTYQNENDHKIEEFTHCSIQLFIFSVSIRTFCECRCRRRRCCCFFRAIRLIGRCCQRVRSFVRPSFVHCSLASSNNVWHFSHINFEAARSPASRSLYLFTRFRSTSIYTLHTTHTYNCVHRYNVTIFRLRLSCIDCSFVSFATNRLWNSTDTTEFVHSAHTHGQTENELKSSQGSSDSHFPFAIVKVRKKCRSPNEKGDRRRRCCLHGLSSWTCNVHTKSQRKWGHRRNKQIK